MKSLKIVVTALVNAMLLSASAFAAQPVPLVEITLDIPQIRDPQVPLRIVVYENGRRVVHVPHYRPNAGVFETNLSDADFLQAQQLVNRLQFDDATSLPDEPTAQVNESSEQQIMRAVSDESMYSVRFNYDPSAAAFRQSVEVPYSVMQGRAQTSVRGAIAVSLFELLQPAGGARHD